jgi:hypothetical protein
MPSGFNCYDVTDSPVIARLWQAHGYDIEPLYRGSSAGDAADGLITVRTTEAEWLAFQSRLSAGAADARDQWTDAPPHLRAIDRHLIDLMSRFPDDARDTQDAADLQTNILWLQTLIEGLERGAVTLIWSAPSVKAGA